jgi:hypothetical protein
MESSRTHYHIPASWITVQRPNGTIEYYGLNPSGGLILTNGRPIPHHVSWAQDSSENAQPFTGSNPLPAWAGAADPCF